MVAAIAIAAGAVCFVVGRSTAGPADPEPQVVARLVAERATADEQLKRTNEAIDLNRHRLEKLEGYNGRLAKAIDDLRATSAKLDDVQSKLTSGRAELIALRGRIQRTKDAPIEMPAGQLVVGHDLPAGRYAVVGDSNFQVFAEDGDLKVNTILGGDYGVKEYVCFLEDGDRIEARGADTFYRIE